MTASAPTRATCPDALLGYDQWVCWRAEDRDGKRTKVPIDPTGGGYASTTDEGTWSSFAASRERVELGAVDGLGFVFTDWDPFVGVDLDDCRDPETGQCDAWAEDIVEKLDSYTEVSPSGTGVHVLVEADLPDGRNRCGDVELYETARFFTVTGRHVDGTPATIERRPGAITAIHSDHVAPDGPETTRDSSPEGNGSSGTLDDEELLRRARTASNGAKFERLYRGDTSGYESHSEADMALCAFLAFWTGGDARQMDRLFRDSGLMREKWDERHFADGSTYGEKTIERAIAGTDDVYDPPAGASTGEETDRHAERRQTVERTRARDRAVARHTRIEELERQLTELLETKEALEAELANERTRREEVEAELEAMRERDGSFLIW